MSEAFLLLTGEMEAWFRGKRRLTRVNGKNS